MKGTKLSGTTARIVACDAHPRWSSFTRSLYRSLFGRLASLRRFTYVPEWSSGLIPKSPAATKAFDNRWKGAAL
jgi:hypothetical protein